MLLKHTIHKGKWIQDSHKYSSTSW